MAYRSFQYVVSGSVQGVGFRHFTKRMADREGIVGWVKNDSSGEVVGIAQGPEHALQRFKQEIENGPRHASVSGVRLTSEEPIDSLQYWTFEIRH
ncbi:acylphosphatase isozyme Ch1 [Abortiporus biennis]|nr:acylphosphatase isozyme Ch1 [Abortiporus biennis]